MFDNNVSSALKEVTLTVGTDDEETIPPQFGNIFSVEIYVDRFNNEPSILEFIIFAILLIFIKDTYNMREFRIDEICNVISGGTPSTKVSSYWNGDIIWLTPKDLSNNTCKWINSSLTTITQEGLENSSARMLPKNAVLLSSRAPIGYLGLAEVPLCTNQGFKSMICNESFILPEYLYYYLQTKVEDLNNISTGSTFKELSGSLLKAYKIYIHELNEQQHIVDSIKKSAYGERLCN